MTTYTELGTSTNPTKGNGPAVALSGEHIERLGAAIENGFTLDEVRQVLRTGLDGNLSLALDSVVPVTGRNLHDICHDLVLWALHDQALGAARAVGGSRAHQSN